MKKLALLAALGLIGLGTPASADDRGFDVGSTCATAGNRSTSFSENAQIRFPGDVDVFRIQVSSPGVINIGSSGTTDTVGEVLDSQCRRIAYNDDSGGNVNFNIAGRIAPGTYYIRVRHYYSTRTGDYRISSSFQRDSTPPPSCP